MTENTSERPSESELHAAIGRQLFDRFHWIQNHPQLKDDPSPMLKYAINGTRKIDPIQTWGVDMGGKFPDGRSIFIGAPKDSGFEGRIICSFTDANGKEALGCYLETKLEGGIRRPVFLEATSEGALTALAQMSDAENPELKPVEIDYNAMPGFIENGLRPLDRTNGMATVLPDYY